MAFGCREMCPMNAVADWHLSQVMGERVGPLHTMIGQEAFRHLPCSTRYSCPALFPACLPLREDRDQTSEGRQESNQGKMERRNRLGRPVEGHERLCKIGYHDF